MLGLKLNHVSKRGHWCQLYHHGDKGMDKELKPIKTVTYVRICIRTSTIKARDNCIAYKTMEVITYSWQINNISCHYTMLAPGRQNDDTIPRGNNGSILKKNIFYIFIYLVYTNKWVNGR